jgi:predicted nucleic acid-binding protein
MTSTLVREELADVLLRKLAPKPATLKQIDALWQMATHIADAPAGHGDNDARLLHAAAAAGAEAFVTGDKAVLNLQAYQGMPILSPRQMFERLMREG